MKKKITLDILYTLSQTVTLQSGTWNKVDILCLLLELMGEYSANVVSD